MNDFNEGAPLAKTAEKLCSINNDSWFLTDSYTLHQTIKSGSGLRISIDFRFIAKDKVSSDFAELDYRTPYFISLDDWNEIGKSKMLYTEDPLKEFTGDSTKSFTKGCEVALKIIDLKK